MPPEMLLRPTVAVEASRVEQCAHCGLLAASAGEKALGPCPACGLSNWIGSDLDVGPFLAGFTAEEHRVFVEAARRARHLADSATEPPVRATGHVRDFFIGVMARALSSLGCEGD